MGIQTTVTAFAGTEQLARGTPGAVAVAVKRALDGAAPGPILVFDDATGHTLEFDIRGSEQAVAEHADRAHASGETATGGAPSRSPRSRGRPRLGVVAREVTLLPRHWEWLNLQPGGASVALRRLVETARRDNAGKDQWRARQEAAYRFMAAIAGDLAGFEEASRALFAGDRARFELSVGCWPAELAAYAVGLAYPERPLEAASQD